MSYLFLCLSIVSEVTGTMLLEYTNNFTKLLITILVIFFYILSFYFLTFAIKNIPISIAYATWAGVGIFLVTVANYFFYNQSLNWKATIGLILIILGVVLVNLHAKKN
tara:strand:- start:1187 stop:1510 length:324 start_codon:yes stop_codon:yes gene_type:complete